MEKIYQKEWEKCLLCHDASCSSQCPVGLDPAKAIRSLKFQNSYGAKEALYSANLCLQCDSKACEEACIANRLGTPIQISKIMEYAHTLKRSKAKVDLSISFLGKECENPFMLSSSVVASNYEMVAKAFDMGWAGVAFKTIGTFIPEEVSPDFQQ